MNTTKVICTGDREWKAADVIESALGQLSTEFPGTAITIIHGAARGADNLVDKVARTLKYNIVRFPALWDVFGPGAGPIRNRDMLDKNPDTALCLAFHDDLIGKSKGTLHMARYAKTKRVPVLVYRSDGSSYDFYVLSSRKFRPRVS